MACGSCHGGHQIKVIFSILVTGIYSLLPRYPKFTVRAEDLHTSSASKVTVTLIS